MWIRRERAVQPLDADRGVRGTLVNLAPVELRERGFRSRRLALLRACEAAQADEAEHMRLDLSLRNLLPDRDIASSASIPGQACELYDGTLETSRLRKAAALEAEDRHRDLPARARLADEVAILDHRAGEEDLAELPASGHLFDAPHLDARLVHVDEKERDALVRLGLTIGPCKQKALVGIVRAARPRLLAIQNPLPVTSLGASAQAGQVAACVWLAEALAEDQLA